MNADFEIRRATEVDVPALTEFGARTFRESFAKDNTAEDMEKHLASSWRLDLQRAEVGDPSIDTLVAVSNDGFAGFAMVRERHSPPGVSTVKPIELWRFYVDKPFHGQGVAAGLMKGAKQRAKQRGASFLWLGVWERNERAKAFYAKHGFSKVGSQVFVVGSDPQTDHVMLCALEGA